MDSDSITLQSTNQSKLINGTRCSSLDDGPIPNTISFWGATVGIVLILTGSFGNLLVIVSVVRNKHLCKAANGFIISLAVCDIFQNIAVKPLYIQTYVTGHWIHERTVCLYALFASNLAILESVLHITAVAFFRYLVIVHPRVGKKIANWKAVLVILFFIFMMPLGLTLYNALPKMKEQNVQFNKRIMFCSFVHHTEFKMKGVIRKVVVLLVAAFVILYSYVRIYCKSRETFKSVHNVDGESSIQPQSYNRIKNDLALLRTVKIIFITFVISYLPLSILYAVDTTRSFPYWLYFIGVMLLWSSSSINWVIYFCVNKRFRRAYRNILCGSKAPRMMSIEVKTSVRFGGKTLQTQPMRTTRHKRPNGSIMSSKSVVSRTHSEIEHCHKTLCHTGSCLSTGN